MNIFKRRTSSLLAVISTSAVLSACSVMPPVEFPRAGAVDVDRFMGDWFVIAHIPPSVVEDSYNNVESYRRGEGNEILTTFTYNEGGFNGEQKVKEPKGFVLEESQGAVWAMQFIWPIKMEYTINYVSDDYSSTVIARSARDYMWIMSRQPTMPENEYRKLVNRISELGYDTSKIRQVPQQPLGQRSDGR